MKRTPPFFTYHVSLTIFATKGAGHGRIEPGSRTDYATAAGRHFGQVPMIAAAAFELGCVEDNALQGAAH